MRFQKSAGIAEAAQLDRREAVTPSDEGTERAGAEKPDRQADVQNLEVGLLQQVSGSLQSDLHQALMERLSVEMLKQPQEVVGRQTGDPGDLGQAEGLMVVRLDELPGPVEALV